RCWSSWCVSREGVIPLRHRADPGRRPGRQQLQRHRPGDRILASNRGPATLAHDTFPGMIFERVFSKAVWEDKVGYCRALKAGNQIYVTGTAPIDEAVTPG